MGQVKLSNAGPTFELLCQLKRILKPGGLLLIDVPNNAVVSLRGRLLHRFPELDLGEHINHFVPSTLDGLLLRAGFTPVRRFTLAKSPHRRKRTTQEPRTARHLH